jgi:4-amino-4-deoxy-L-arabinose transferase-like glycosyltransferase
MPDEYSWPIGHRLSLLAVVCCFCVPLFIGLDNWDLRNDEAIYTYAVERILETGDWLTPRSIPLDGPFLEKPPLKFWIVAGAIRLGLLPYDEFGFRFVDALFGAAAFIYVFLLARRFAGAIAGFVAVLVLFTCAPLIFEHGFRSNNMEAAVVLAYCGGMFHFASWVEERSKTRRFIHAIAFGLYFTLGFMTKLVAILFLPVVCAVALFWRNDGVARIRSSWREWMAPLTLVLVLTTPWFVYQAIHAGAVLWQTMVAEHVVTRLTGTLNPQHLEPWHYYFSQAWFEATLVGSQWIALLGALLLMVKAGSGRPWLARLLLLWWILPMAVISTGTSKVFHYAYPFLPPLAIGAGVAAAELFHLIERNLAHVLALAARRFRRWTWSENEQHTTGRSVARQLITIGAVFASVLGVWTALAGRVQWEVNGVQILRNSTVSRPIVAATILFLLAGPGVLRPVLTAVVVALVLPVSAYPSKVKQTTTIDRPLRSLRDCVVTLGQFRPQTHIYDRYGNLLTHSYFYYLGRVGPWVRHGRIARNNELRRKVFAPGDHTLVLLSRDNYERFQRQILADAGDEPMPLGLTFADNVVLLTPGPFAICAGGAISEGGRRAGGVPSRE